MTKSELIQKLAVKYGLPNKQARLIVDALFNNIILSLASSDKVILRGFGVFALKILKARLSRNPQTGEEIQVGERRSIAFKAGRSLHGRINASENI